MKKANLPIFTVDNLFDSGVITKQQLKVFEKYIKLGWEFNFRVSTPDWTNDNTYQLHYLFTTPKGYQYYWAWVHPKFCEKTLLEQAKEAKNIDIWKCMSPCGSHI